jgi:cell wall-associated NlpC family hydrolase
MATLMTLTVLTPVAATASEVPPTARLAVQEIRPVTPQRAGRDFFRIRTVGALPTPSRKVAHPAKPKPPKLPVRKAAPSKARKAQPPATYSVAASGSIGVVIRFALAQVGKRYVWGTSGPSTYDCSGLLLASFARVGIRVPHQSGAIGGMGRAVPRSQWRAGVVIHYSGHVALAISATMMVEAPHAGANVRVVPIRPGGSGRWLF